MIRSVVRGRRTHRVRWPVAPADQHRKVRSRHDDGKRDHGKRGHDNRGHDNRDRGSVTLQYVIILPAMFLLIFTCIQVAMYSFARSVAITAAEEGVNAQRVLGASPGAGKARAKSVVNQEGDSLQDVSVSVRVVGNEVVVTVTGRTQSVLFGFAGYTVTQTARGPIEEFNP